MSSIMPLTSQASFFPYLYRGIVKDNGDPNNLGRCKIHVPGVYGHDDYDSSLLPWSRPITTGKRIVIPDIGEVVWVIFEGGQRNSPVYIVGTLSTKNTVENIHQDIIYQNDYCKIYYDKESKKLFLGIEDNTIEITSEGISIKGYEGGGSGSMYFDVIEVVG